MEAVSLGISVASIASILQTCIAGYRALNGSFEMADGAIALSLRFHIQEMWLRLWGRSAGVNFEDDRHNGQDDD